jgi:hypothetical protein
MTHPWRKRSKASMFLTKATQEQQFTENKFAPPMECAANTRDFASCIFHVKYDIAHEITQ